MSQARTPSQLTLLCSTPDGRWEAIKVCQDWLNKQYQTRPNDGDAVYKELTERLVTIDKRYPQGKREIPPVYIAADALHMMEHAQRVMNRQQVMQTKQGGTSSDDDDDDDDDETTSDDDDDAGGLLGQLAIDDGSINCSENSDDEEEDDSIDEEDDDSENVGRKVASQKSRRRLF